MRRSFIFDQGTSEFAEDGLVHSERVVGVLDGVSTPYGPATPPTMYGSLSSGEMVVRAIEHLFVNEAGSKSLTEILEEATEMLRTRQHGRVPHQSDMLAGTAFALAEITPDAIHIVQVGDCFAVINFTDGSLVVTPYQMRGHEEANRRNRETVFAAAARDLFGCAAEDISPEQQETLRIEFWRRYPPIWMKQRRQDLNNRTGKNAFGLLNGQRECLDLLYKASFRRNAVKSVFFFTDGIIHPEVLSRENDEAIGRTVSHTLHEGGWPQVLAEARRGHKKAAATHYISYPEAAGLAIEF